MGAGVIGECGTRLAAAVAARVGEAVPVTDHPPDTVAGPAVYVRFAAVRWDPAGWMVTHEVVVTAADGLGAEAAAEQVADLTDKTLAGAQAVAPSDRIDARAEPSRAGDTAAPGSVVTVAQLNPFC